MCAMYPQYPAFRKKKEIVIFLWSIFSETETSSRIFEPGGRVATVGK